MAIKSSHQNILIHWGFLLFLLTDSLVLIFYFIDCALYSLHSIVNDMAVFQEGKLLFLLFQHVVDFEM